MEGSFQRDNKQLLRKQSMRACQLAKMLYKKKSKDKKKLIYTCGNNEVCNNAFGF